MASDDFDWKVDIPISTMLLAAWGSYIYWSTLHPDLDKISYGLTMGYTFTLMALLLVTILLLRLEKGLIALAIVFSPFLLACLLFLYVRWYFSFLFVFNAWIYRTSNVSKECCRLCERCQSIVNRSPLLVGSRWLFSRSTERHSFYTKEELEESAKNCHMCVLVLESVEEFSESVEKENTKFNSGLTLVIRDRRPFDILSREVNLNLELSGSSISKARRVPVKRDGLRISAYNKKRTHLCYHSMQTDTPDIFDWASHWIQQCQKEHEKCNNKFIPESADHYLPLRLLDVGGHEDETISLKLSSQLREEHPKDYIALSHCWGEAVNLTLTKSNIDDIENLHISCLTKNFQHAVRIARALNIRYLWIDSLCIVQDDDTEWETESANMGLVYANSKCVVSASASKDSNGGCFMPKELFRNDCTLRGSTHGSIVISASHHRSFEASLKLFTDKAENTVLNTRAWTFQERYLARRVLHFCEGAVFFECNELVVHDGIRYAGSKYPVRAGVRYDGTLHPPDEYEAVQRPVERFTTAPLPGRARRSAIQPSENPEYTEQKKQMEKLLAMSARSGMRGAFELLWRFKGTALAEKVEFHQSWFEMVEKYSARKLTRGTDKLKAMSGIAYFIQKNTTLQYSAGLWKEMLVFNLLWVVCSPPEEKPVRNIPSWSWGSVDGRISHRLKVSELPKESEETNNTPQPRQFESTWKEIIPLISEENIQAIEQVNDLILDAKLFIKGYLHSSTSHHVNTIYDVIFLNLSAELFYLPVLAFENTKVHPMGSKIQVHGLVLRPKSDERETYERVGYFWTVNDAVVEQMLPQTSQKKLIYLV